MLRNILAFLAGGLIGMAANMSLILVGSKVVPLLDGMDPMNAENWDLTYFVFPFLAHAIGTLLGAFIAAKFSSTYHFILANIIGLFFLIGGITMALILPAPNWFIQLDLILAYMPMSVLAWKLSGRKFNSLKDI